MAEPELLLDSNIRLWVVLPIVFITFLVGVIRHYVSILLQSDKKLTLEQVSDSQVLIRSRILRENGKYIPKQSFLMRKFYFNNQEDGFFKKTKRKVVPPSPPEEDGQPMWVTVTIDFQSLITRECNAHDYEEWLAHSTDESDTERDGCVLGVKETYRRLKKQSVCRNGRGFVVSKRQSPCLCTREDYLCDYGYYRHVNTSDCVRQSSSANKTLELCLNGEEDELLTAGYRKVPSDRCEGGFSPQLAVQTVIRPCGVKTSPGPPARSSSPVTHFDTPRERLVLILVCAGAGVIVLVAIVSSVFAVKRVVYRNRTPVYRFSNLQIQDDDNGITADLESATSSNGAACQQDSDDELIE